MGIGEFDLIARYFCAPQQADGLVKGIGDDAALVSAPSAQCMAALHWREDIDGATDSARIARKLTDDIAEELHAQNAALRWIFLALTLPKNDPVWLSAFSGALAATAASHNALLVGGDTTQGPLAISLFGFGGPRE